MSNGRDYITGASWTWWCQKEHVEPYVKFAFEDAQAGKPYRPEYDGWDHHSQIAYELARHVVAFGGKTPIESAENANIVHCELLGDLQYYGESPWRES